MLSGKRTSITIGLPDKKRKELNALAAKSGITAASIVRSLLYARLEEERKPAV